MELRGVPRQYWNDEQFEPADFVMLKGMDSLLERLVERSAKHKGKHFVTVLLLWPSAVGVRIPRVEFSVGQLQFHDLSGTEANPEDGVQLRGKRFKAETVQRDVVHLEDRWFCEDAERGESHCRGKRGAFEQEFASLTHSGTGTDDLLPGASVVTRYWQSIMTICSPLSSKP